MKFMFAVVILAFVAYTNANAIGQVLDVAYPGAPVGSHGPALYNSWGKGGYNGGWGWNGAGIDGYGGHGPSLYVDGWGAHGDAHGHDGKYVASNRGAVHVAPLVGHIQSVKSTNADPAPGTNW